jgi:hypothetical protein
MIVRCIDSTSQRDVLVVGRKYEVQPNATTGTHPFRLRQTIQQDAV